jgi:hypothetical protein
MKEKMEEEKVKTMRKGIVAKGTRRKRNAGGGG